MRTESDKVFLLDRAKRKAKEFLYEKGELNGRGCEKHRSLRTHTQFKKHSSSLIREEIPMKADNVENVRHSTNLREYFASIYRICENILDASWEERYRCVHLM